jgi:hypothetical protein
MASQIETALYGPKWASRVSAAGEVGEHCLLELSIGEAMISIRVAPWPRRYADWTLAVFRNASLGRFGQTASEPDDLSLPWSIVGFHCQQQDDGQWSFNLNCDYSRWSWSSDWPEIQRSHSAENT